jgi:hypothetical protein
VLAPRIASDDFAVEAGAVVLEPSDAYAYLVTFDPETSMRCG